MLRIVAKWRHINCYKNKKVSAYRVYLPDKTVICQETNKLLGNRKLIAALKTLTKETE